MAPPAAAPRGGDFDLKRKVGRLPVWAWGLIGTTTIFLGWRYYKNAKAAKAAATSTTTAVPASNAPYNGLGAGIGGGYGGGTPFTVTPAPEQTVTTPISQLPTQAPALSAPAPTPLPQIPGGLQPSYLLGLGLTPDQISGVLQPQNQPSVNPNVSPAPTIALPVGGTLAPPTGVGQRYLSPGPNPFPFTAG